MTAVVDRLYEAMLMVFLLYAAALIFVEHAQFAAPVADPSVQNKAIPRLWKFGARDWPSGLLWFLLVPFTLVKDVVIAPVSGLRLAFDKIALFVLILVVSAVRSTAKPRAQRVTLLSRGFLVDGIRDIARKTGGHDWPGPSVYILDDAAQGMPLAPTAAAVVMPRPFLDSLSRREIDAMALWQLCRQSERCHALPLRKALIGEAVATGALEWLVSSPVIRGVGLLALLAAQTAALAKYLPQERLEADLRAAKLTGDPELFLSAVARLFRFRGVPIAPKSLQRMARRIGISSGRVPDLLADRAAPAEDRYPTTGSYLETGLC